MGTPCARVICMKLWRVGIVGLAALSAIGGTGCSAAADDGAESGDDAVTSSDTATPIKHVVLIVQENHSFDSYFGKYCTAETGSKPACHDGPGCCEAAPAHIWSAHYLPIWPEPLTDDFNVALDRIHSSECEYYEMHCSDAA